MNGTAVRVAHNDNQLRSELFCREFDASDERRSDDVTGNADDEEIADALVEYDFRGYSRVGASKDDGERFLV